MSKCERMGHKWRLVGGIARCDRCRMESGVIWVNPSLCSEPYLLLQKIAEVQSPTESVANESDE